MKRRVKALAQPSRKEDMQMEPSTSAPLGKGRRLRAPISKRDLTVRENIILWRGSELNGSKFPPWDSPPAAADFDHKPGQAQYLDNTEFRLSNTQRKVFKCWQRPGVDAENGRNLDPTRLHKGKVDLVQDITSDCSVVASLCAVTARKDRGQSDVITCNFYPHDETLQQPIISPNGKYVLRLHFNGCSRKVVIDDRLPASRTAQSLHVIDRNQPALLWPALFEKAYLKVRGGYDFPGSNSGTDLYALTGWIPEQLFLQRRPWATSDDIARNTLWKRIYNGFNYGDVLITMGTGKMTRDEESGLGLVGEHDYAVVDMKEQAGQQLFLVKNPSSKAAAWKGHIYRGVDISDHVETFADLRITPETEPLPPGIFWIGLNDVFQSFESIYLNWNPNLFVYREALHFDWDLAKSRSPEGSFMSNPQYEIRSGAGGTVWVLLSKHFTSTSEPSVNAAEVASSIAYPLQGFVSLYAFDNEGEKVFLSDGAIMSGPYVDSPNTLLKLELPPQRAYTIVISEQELPSSLHTFTLSAYSQTSLTISTAREKYTHCKTHGGAWTTGSAGGNASSPYYHNNPQYSIILTKTSDIALLLETPTHGFPIHVKLVWARGKQVHSITTRDIVGDSGEYTKGYAFAEIHQVPAGAYTIVCSTFEQGQLGVFTLRVSSMSPCTVARVVGEAAGRFVTNAQAAEFRPGNDRLLAPLITRRLNRVSLTARSRGGASRSERSLQSPLKLGLEHGRGPSMRVLAVSADDEYVDSPVGVRTVDVDIQPSLCEGRGVFVVIERLGSSGLQQNEYVDVELLSDGPIELGNWRITEGL